MSPGSVLAVGSCTSETIPRGRFDSRPLLLMVTNSSSRPTREPSKLVLPLCGSLVTTFTSNPLNEMKSRSVERRVDSPGDDTSSMNGGRSASTVSSAVSRKLESAWLSACSSSTPPLARTLSVPLRNDMLSISRPSRSASASASSHSSVQKGPASGPAGSSSSAAQQAGCAIGTRRLPGAARRTRPSARPGARQQARVSRPHTSSRVRELRSIVP
mmetsp:Transcript_27699/g.73298  ORF Transcript_27699/g.73298 Transcript_27699/m.73298 type:complete len:215 (+) Transcript_27699:251-895(+)